MILFQENYYFLIEFLNFFFFDLLIFFIFFIIDFNFIILLQNFKQFPSSNFIFDFFETGSTYQTLFFLFKLLIETEFVVSSNSKLIPELFLLYFSQKYIL